METPRKRKRDEEDLPRISYDAATRTFDRLFKEESLEGMKQVVRRKLGVSSVVPVYLSQMRDGKSVDLEDDDDFEAFQSAAYSSGVTQVRVVLGGDQPPTRSLVPQTPSRKNKDKKRKKSDASLSSTESHTIVVEDPTLTDNSRTPKKRRVSFVEPPSESEVASLHMLKKKKEKTRSAEGSKERQQEKASDEDSERKKKKKEKEKASDIRPKEPQSVPSKPATQVVARPETSTDVSKSITSTKSTDVPVEKQSKKRPTTIDKALSSNMPPSKPAEETAGATDTQPPKKKRKKKHVEGLDANVEASEPSSSNSPEAVPAPAAPPTPSNIASGQNEPQKSRKTKDKMVSETPGTASADTPVDPEGVPTAKTTKMSTPKSIAGSTERAKTKPTKEKVTKAKPTAPPEPTEPRTLPQEASGTPQGDAEPKKKRKKVEQASKKPQVPPSEQPATDKGSAPEDPRELEHSPSAAGETTTKRTRRKSTGADATPPTDLTQDKTTDGNPPEEAPINLEARKAVTRAAVMEILARNKNLSSSVSNPPPATTPTLSVAPEPPRDDDAPQIGPKSTGKAKTRASTKDSSAKETTLMSSDPPSASRAHYRGPAKCPICGEGPQHVISRCPQVKAGMRAMRKRLAELEQDDSEDHSEGIKELQSIIEKRSKKKTPAAELAQPTAALETESAPASATNPTSGPDEPPSQPAQTKPAPGPSTLPAPPNSAPVQNKSIPAQSNTRLVPTKSISGPHKPVRAADILSAARARLSSSQPRPSSPVLAQPSSSTQAAASSQPRPPSSQPPPSTVQNPSPAEPPLTQLSLSTQKKSSQKQGQPSSQKQPPPPPPKTPVPKLPPSVDTSIILPNNPSASPFLGIGDLSRFTEKDLEELVRGPRMSLKDVPTSDSSDEEDSQDNNNVMLEEDEQEEEPKTFRTTALGRRLIRYPISSDEEDEEDGEDTNSNEKPPDRSTTTAQRNAVAEMTPASSEERDGELSFQQVNALGSSIEPDLTGNAAVDKALAKDLSVFNLPEPALSTQRRVAAAEADSDTAVASQGEERSHQPTSKAKSKDIPAPAHRKEDGAADPIEPSDELPATQPDPIFLSDDDSPLPAPAVQSTPRVEGMIRTRSQRNKASSQSQPSQTREPVDDAKSTRRTRSLTKISALPIPVPPSSNSSIRVIKSSSGPAGTEPKETKEDSQANNKEQDEDEMEPPAKKGRGAGKTPAKANKTPAKTPAKAGKTPAKSTSKAAAKTPAKITTKPASTPAAIARTRSTRAKAADPEPIEEPEIIEIDLPTKSSKDNTVGFWSVLQENNTSQADTETPAVDELASSPARESQSQPTVSQETGPNEHSQEPLFIESETQQSFPYSQYPDLLANKAANVARARASPSDSDDEEEVENAVSSNSLADVVKKIGRTLYRPLTEIASSQSFSVPRFQPAQFEKKVLRDLYGRVGREEEPEPESTDSESDDDGGGKPPASHIPASRRAGVASLRL